MHAFARFAIDRSPTRALAKNKRSGIAAAKLASRTLGLKYRVLQELQGEDTNEQKKITTIKRNGCNGLIYIKGNGK